MASSSSPQPNPDDLTIEWLEGTIESLEKRLIGQRMIPENQADLIDCLLQINDRVTSVTCGSSSRSDRFYSVNRALDSLEDLLSDVHSSSCVIDVPAAKEFIFSEESRIIRDSDLLQEIQRLQPLMEGMSGRLDEEELGPKLQVLRVQTLSQLEEWERMTLETQKLIESYGSLVQLMKGRLASWDSRLRKLRNNWKQEEARGTLDEGQCGSGHNTRS